MHQLSSEVENKVFFSQHVQGFTNIEHFPLRFTLFQSMSRFITYHSCSKIGKNMGTLGKFSTNQKTIFYFQLNLLR